MENYFLARHNKQGKILEKIVALFHEEPGFIVTPNVRLPTKDGKDNVEIDVLVKSSLRGYDIQLAFECKNWNKPVGRSAIIEFADKLSEVGIFSIIGFVVSTSSYTKGAIRKANQSGIHLLDLTGLSKDKIKPHLIKAQQSIIHLLPVIEMVSSPMASGLEKFSILGAFQDSLWHLWRDGTVPHRIGCYIIDMEGSQGKKKYRFLFKVKVLAIAHIHCNRAEFYQLSGTQGKLPRKMRINFGSDDNNLKFEVRCFETEAELKENQKRNKVSIDYKIASPRLRSFTSYWPLSKKAAMKIKELSKAGKHISFEEVEGTSIDAIFEPICQEFTFAKTHKANNPSTFHISVVNISEVFDDARKDEMSR